VIEQLCAERSIRRDTSWPAHVGEHTEARDTAAGTPGSYVIKGFEVAREIAASLARALLAQANPLALPEQSLFVSLTRR
jgi:hypothetical protein